MTFHSKRNVLGRIVISAAAVGIIGTFAGAAISMAGAPTGNANWSYITKGGWGKGGGTGTAPQPVPQPSSAPSAQPSSRPVPQPSSQPGMQPSPMPSTTAQPMPTCHASIRLELIEAVKHAAMHSAVMLVHVDGLQIVDPVTVKEVPAPCQGHIHFRLDDLPESAGASLRLDFHKIPSGHHTITAYLAGNDHTPYGVQDSLTLDIP